MYFATKFKLKNHPDKLSGHSINGHMQTCLLFRSHPPVSRKYSTHL
jgi:hypothetical protein